MSLAGVTVGDELEPYVVAAVDPQKMKLMSALMRDPNPIHFDPAAVAALGLGDRAISQGPATLSFLTNMLTGWARSTAALQSLTARLNGNVFAGDRVECRGRVTEVDAETGLITVEVEARVGESVVATGTAVVGA